MHKLIFYGDSNTYGYDPRGWLGMRYGEDIRWAAAVKKALLGRYDVMEEGMNGRMLPDEVKEGGYLFRLLLELEDGDIFVMMLGTNDILLTDHPDADIPIAKMRSFLETAERYGWLSYITIIAPVPVSFDGELRFFHAECMRMNDAFGEICEKMGVRFIDASEWKVPLSGDGVHFSEEGHRVFAENLMQMIAF